MPPLLRSNTFFIQRLNMSTEVATSRTMLAGSIIASVANFVLIIVFGVRDEKSSAQKA